MSASSGNSSPVAIVTVARRGIGVQVAAELTRRGEQAPPGMTAEVHFAHPKPTGLLDFDGVVITMAAVRQDMDGRMSVFVFDQASSTLRQTTIVAGGVLDNEIAVKSGLHNDDIVATAGISFLTDGQTVRLLE